MSYNIQRTDGTSVAIVEENVIDYDSVSNIGLIGQLTPNYGNTQSNNFVRLAENFANTSAPSKPLLGMTYYNKTRKQIFLCIDETTPSWIAVPIIRTSIDGETTDYNDGEMFYDNQSKEFKIFDVATHKWIVVGPNNYFHNSKYHHEVSTTKLNSTLDITSNPISFNEETSYSINVKVVAHEQFNEITTNEPNSSAWVYNLLVRKYNGISQIIGSPSYNLIGQTDGASKWGVEFDASNNKLTMTVTGKPNNGVKINWELETEVLKV